METDKLLIDQVNIDDIIVDINREVDNLFKYTNDEGKTIILVAEKFYFRIESNLSATIIIDHIYDNKYQVIIVVAGGKHGILGLTWGAEGSMLKRIKNVFLKHTTIF
ncbi:MAG: DUF6054 family protein [Candidatus Hermodarchaeota archaeon]